MRERIPLLTSQSLRAKRLVWQQLFVTSAPPRTMQRQERVSRGAVPSTPATPIPPDHHVAHVTVSLTTRLHFSSGYRSPGVRIVIDSSGKSFFIERRGFATLADDAGLVLTSRWW